MVRNCMETSGIFEEAAHKATEKKDRADFCCPVCKGSAWAMRPVPGGHIWAACRQCDLHMIE